MEITDTGIEGEGIGKTDGFILFVKDAVIGDTVQVKVMKAKKNYAYAKLEKVLVPSPFRVQPPCPCLLYTSPSMKTHFFRSLI